MRAVVLAVCICWAAAAVYAYRTHATSQSQLTRQLQDSCSGHPQLTLVNEAPFSDMFEDAKGQTKFEGSALALLQGKAWVAFDNMFALARLPADLDSSSNSNGDEPVLIGQPAASSQYEALTYDSSTGRLLVVVEGVDTGKGIMPYVHELAVQAGSAGAALVQKCPVNFKLASANKGFEGAHVFKGKDGGRYLLGLCEGNFCSSGEKGRRPGNGRLLVTKFNGKAAGAGCAWDYVKTLNIPSDAYFEDYSDIAVSGNQVAIISQASSSLWLGSFDFDALAFAPGKGSVFDFPRTDKCNVKYCNVEGIAFLGAGRFLVVSDKASSSKQADRCQKHDQRISTFALPQ